jgi:hypothetical protein
MSTQPQSVREMEPPALPGMAERPALKVWAYEVPAVKNDGFFLELPAEARIVSVSRAAGNMTAKLYAVVNPRMPNERRFFYVAQVNFPLPDPQGVSTNPSGTRFRSLKCVGSYLGWGQMLHLFELEQEREPGDEG